MNIKRIIQQFHVDLPLFFSLLGLSVIGLVVLYSAGGESTSLLFKQVTRLAIAFTVMFIIAQITPRHLFRMAILLYIVGLILLLLILVFGEFGKGAQRWLEFGMLRFQPSEIMKIVLPLMIAWYIAERPLTPNIARVFVACILIAIPVALIATQPDLGTAVLVASTGVFVLLLAGVSRRFIGSVSLLAVSGLPVLWFLMHDYQRRRVLTFLDPEQDPLGSGYHIIQSKIAVGSGGLYGKGWLNGTQSQLEFLPERTTDFIFAVYSEEFGLMGVLVLLAVYTFIIARGMYIAMHAQETAGRLLAGSLVLTLFVYIFVNMGMVIGLMPVVGVPLPLLSYGGSSLVTLMASFGILMSIHTHKRLLSG